MTVPSTFTPGEGVKLATAALEHAQGAVRGVAGRFRGTVPPPPWPATAGIVAARRRVEAMRAGFGVFVKGGLAFAPGKMPAIAGALRREVATLEAEVGALAKASADLPGIPTPGQLVAKLGGNGPWLVLGLAVVLWLDRDA